MPLDPMLANPATVKLNDPLEQYNNYLLAASRKSSMGEARRKQQYQNALRQVFKMPGVLKADGTLDQGVFMNALAQADVGDAIPDQLKGLYDINKTAAEIGLTKEKANTEKAEQGLKGSQAKKADADAVETQAKAFDQEWNNSRKLLFGISPDPKVGVNQFAAWIDQQFAHPVIGKGLRERGMTPEKMKAELAAAKTGKDFQAIVMKAAMDMKDATEVNYRTEDVGGWSLTRAENARTLGAPESTIIDKQKVTESPKAPRVSVSVGAPSVSVIAAKGDTSYTEEWNKELAKDDIGLKRAADAAPELARRADRIDAVLRSGKVITGVGAPFLLNVAKVLNTVGASDAETIANTETLISDLARNTLDHIKSSGLGAGNGFTDKDREFLERAVGGQISISAEGLRRLAALSRRAAQLSAQKWADRKAERDRSGIQGRANPGAAPSVPPAPGSMKGTNGKTISAASIAELKRNPTPQERAEFDAYFGAGSAARVLGK